MAKLPGIYELMATTASPAINFARGVIGYQDPFLTQTMQDRMRELESQKGPVGDVSYEDYGLDSSAGRFTGGLLDLFINNPVDFGLAGSVGKYSYSPEGRTGLTYDFTPDRDTGSTGNAILDFINRGGLKKAISPIGTAEASDLGAIANLTNSVNKNNAVNYGISGLYDQVYRNDPMNFRTTAPKQDFKELTGPQIDFGSTFNTPDLASNIPTIMNPGTPQSLGFDTSFGIANEEDEEQVEFLGSEPKGIAKLFQFLGNLPTPFNLVRRGLESLRGFNDRIRQSDFGQSRNLMDYLDIKKYGSYQDRENARAATMAQARGIQKKIDRGDFGGPSVSIDRGRTPQAREAAIRSRDLTGGPGKDYGPFSKR